MHLHTLLTHKSIQPEGFMHGKFVAVKHISCCNAPSLEESTHLPAFLKYTWQRSGCSHTSVNNVCWWRFYNFNIFYHSQGDLHLGVVMVCGKWTMLSCTDNVKNCWDSGPQKHITSPVWSNLKSGHLSHKSAFLFRAVDLSQYPHNFHTAQ